MGCYLEERGRKALARSLQVAVALARSRYVRRIVVRFPARVLLALALMPVQQAIGAAEQEYQFGVHPYLVPRSMAAAFGPAALDMSAALKRPVRFLTATSFDKFLDNLKNRVYDIAIVQPFDYPRAVTEFGYLPLARVDAQLRAVFVVMENSRFQQLADLEGQQIAMAPAEAATSRQGEWALSDAGLRTDDNITVVFLRTHDACLHEVLRGGAAACVTGPPPMQEFVARTGAKMRVLATTAPVPHMAAVVQPRVPPEQRETLRRLMLSWKGSAQGSKVLAAMQFPGWVELREGDYSPIQLHMQDVSAPAPPGQREEGLLFGTFPYFQPRRVAAHLAPLVESLAALAQEPVQLRTTTSYDQFEENLRAQKYDIALINPFEFVLAKQAGYEPVARFSEDLQAFFYVKRDSGVADLAGLRGKSLAMPPANAVLSLLAREYLLEQGLDPDRDVHLDYRPSHDSCLERMLSGEADACVTAPIAVELAPDTQRFNLRSVAKTMTVPSLVMVVHPRHAQTLMPRVRDGLLALHDREQGREVLKRLGLGDVVSVEPERYLALPLL